MDTGEEQIHIAVRIQIRCGHSAGRSPTRTELVPPGSDEVQPSLAGFFREPIEGLDWVWTGDSGAETEECPLVL